MKGRDEFIRQVKNTLAINMDLILFKKHLTMAGVVNLCENYPNLPPLSRMVIHCIKYGEKLPRIDKIFILGELMDVDPRQFLVPRNSGTTSSFLSLSDQERKDAVRILADQENN